MSRGVLYITWPSDKPMATMLDRSISSLLAVHPELPYYVAKLDEGATLLDKAKMFDLSPFDETLFLDADAVALGRLDHGFDMASRHDMACCICECPWARRYPCFDTDDIEYNTGVMFFTRGAKPVFDRWKEAAGHVDSSITFHGENGLSRMPLNDQAGFAVAIHDTQFNPFVLPLNWNFRPRWHKGAFGPIKVWHDYDDVPAGVRHWNESQSGPNAVISCMQLA